MDNIEKMLVQLMTVGLIASETKWFKSKGITVKIELEDIDFDFIDKAIAEADESEDKPESKVESKSEDGVDSSELRAFFDAKFESEKHENK